MEILSEVPRVVRYKKFLSDEEVAMLLALAEGKWARSTVVDNDSGSPVVSEYRTGELFQLMDFKNAAIKAIEERIASVTDTRPEQGEAMQLVRYGVGDQYMVHHDWFDPKIAGSAKQLVRGGQRVKTALLYLKVADLGGQTAFPSLAVTITPEIGDAVIFDNDATSLRSDHAGLLVAMGEKIVCTRWIRERAADGSEETEVMTAAMQRQTALADAKLAAKKAHELAAEAVREESELRVAACKADIEAACAKHRCRFYGLPVTDIDPRTGGLRIGATVELDPMV